jgi:hypothetical protein
MSNNLLLPILGLTAGVLLLGFVLAFKSDAPQASSLSTREVATTCDPEMGNLFHIHPTLEIRIEGEKYPIEGNIGVTSTCMTRLHTHDADGTIHVESPEVRDFTLGDFFAVWGKTFTKNQLFDYVAGNGKAIRVTVDGVEVDTYEHTVLTDKAHILIRYE